MCGRMTILTYDEVLDAIRAIRAGELADPFQPDVEPAARKDAFPQSWVPVAMPAPDAPDLLEARVLNWGYPVSWQASPIFNTRIESVLQGGGMWRESAERRRCLVPTVRFYERHGSETVRSRKSGRPVRRMYEFALADEPITWLAGVYEDDHFSVVTTRPNDWVAPVHDRMPLVLRQADLPRWLGEGYAQLADRSGVVLDARPEADPDGPEAVSQLSLF